MSTVLVFGGDGQVGRELSRVALEGGAHVRSVGRRETDITDVDAVGGIIAAVSPAVVVNAAAYTKVDRAEDEPDEAFLANATGAGVIASACAGADIPLVHLSTDYVFDGTKRGAYRETDPIAPLGVYGRSKAEGEVNIRNVLERHIIIRTSWVYGVYGSNFLKTILRLARERHELRVVADQRGCPTGTTDLAHAILCAASRLASDDPVYGTFHLAGLGVTTWHDFASEIVAAQAASTGRNPSVIPITTADYPTPARRPANSELDSSRFTETFRFSAIYWRMRARAVTAELLGNAPVEKAF